MRHPDGCCQQCGEHEIAETIKGVICSNGHISVMDSENGSEHFLEETAGLFGKTIYQCRHCGERSPDEEYFGEIHCPPSIDDV